MGNWRSWPGLGVLAVLAVLGQLYGLYRVTGPPTPHWFPQADKLEHLLGFALPTALVLLTVAGRQRGGPARPPQRTTGLVVAVFAAHAVVSELVQHAFYAGRTGDPFDVLADWTGTALGLVVALALLRPADRAAAPDAVPGR